MENNNKSNGRAYWASEPVKVSYFFLSPRVPNCSEEFSNFCNLASPETGPERIPKVRMHRRRQWNAVANEETAWKTSV